MAVAAQLAKIRGTTSARVAPPTVVHENARDAAKIPRTEIAGSALNALESLGACDSILRALPAALLLKDLADRAIIDSEREKHVSHAVTVAAHRLAPVYPTRAAQRVVEWIVRGIDAGRLGSDAEVDALLVAALPFHTTPQFVRLAHALLAPQHRGSQIRPSWEWLAPVTKEKTSPSFSFVVANASDSCLQAAVVQMAVSAVAAVPVAPITGFIASVVASRLLSPRSSPLKRRTLALVCLDALCFKHKRFTLLTGKRKKKHKPSPSASKEMNRAKVALLVALATAVAGNMLEKEIVEAVLHAAIRTVTCEYTDRPTADTAAACIVVCVGRMNYAPMSFDMTKSLMKWGRFAEVLDQLQGTSGISETYASYLSSIALNIPENQFAIESLMKGLSIARKELLSNSTIETVLCHLLEAFSKQIDDESEREELKNILAKLLQPIARGAYAEGVDNALRKHFDERRAKKKARPRYAIVDDALVEAMAGTPYVAVKTDAESSTLSEHTLLNCLEHPEPRVRIAGIKRLMQEKALIENTQVDSQFGKRLRSVLMRCIRDDSDVKVVAVTLESKLIEQFCVHKDVLFAIGQRIRKVLEPISRKKRSKLSGRVKDFVREAVVCCSRLTHENTELIVLFESLLIGLEIDGTLSKHTLCVILGDELSGNIRNFANLMVDEETLLAVDNLIKDRWDKKTLDVIASLFLWEQDWGLICVEKVYGDNSSGATKEADTVLGVLKFLLESCVANQKGGRRRADQALSAIVNCMKLMDEVSDENIQEIQSLWSTLAVHADLKTLKTFVGLACEKLKPKRVFFMLLDVAKETQNRRAKEVALTWAAALVKAGMVEENGDILVRILLITAYHGAASTVSLGVCKQLSVNEVKKCAGEAAVKVFRALKRVSGKMGGAFDPEMDDVERDNLSRRVLETLPNNEKPCSVASVLKESNGELVSTVLSIFVQNEQNSFLACLRSLEGAVADTPESLWAVLQALAEILGEEDFEVEKFVRLVALLPNAVDGRTSTVDVLAVAKKLVERTGVPGDANEAVAAGLCKIIALLREVCDKNEIGTVADDAVDALFSLATQSNAVGSFAAQSLSNVVHVGKDFERLTGRLDSKRVLGNAPAKRRRTPARRCTQRGGGDQEEEQSLLPEDIRRSAVTGALEALTRNEDVSEDVRANLWTFARKCAETVKDDSSKADLTDCEYDLALVLRTLAKSADQLLEPDDAAAAVNLCFYEGSEGSTLNVAAAELVRALAKKNAAQLCAYIAPFLKLLLSKESTKSTTECLSAIVPALLADGDLGIGQFMKIALDANPGAASGTRLSVLDCVQLCDDRASAASAAVDIVLEEGEADAPIRLATKLVLCGGRNACEILDILSGRKDGRLAMLAVNVLEDPGFIRTLDETLSEAVVGKKEQLENLDKAFAKLYAVLLKSEDETERPKALAALMSVIPGSVVCRCISEALNGKDEKRKMRALNSVIELLDWNTRITDTWVGNEGNGEEPTIFVTKLCETVRGCVSSDGLQNNAKAETVRLATETLEKAAKRWQPEMPELLVEMRNCGSVLASLLGDVPKLRDGDILARVLTSLASFITVIGRTGAVFVPTLTAAVAAVVEETPKTRAKHPLLDAAMAAAHEVLLSAPKMFGKKALKRIAAVAVVAGREQIISFLHAAVAKVPAVSSVEALSHALNSSKNDANACRVVMHAVVQMLNSVRKRDVRELRGKIFKLCLDVLDFRRRTCKDEEGHVVDVETTSCTKVEEAVFGAVGELMLRLAEAPVNELFATAAAWAADEALDEEEVERLGVDCPATILRIYPLLGMYGSLFGTLGRFAVKPFGALLNDALVLVRSRPTKLTSTLGKRPCSDGVICIEAARGEGARTALGATEKFLRAIPDATAVSEEALERVRDAVAAALNGGADVRACVAALAERMCVSDEIRTKEQCRTMLIGLSRAILGRARDETAVIRRKALESADSILEAVGEEYLVALPEAMPILADTVDDEEEDVVRATKEFVRRLEAYTGQPILDELKV